MFNFLEKYINWLLIGTLLVLIVFIFSLVLQNANLKLDKLNLQREIDGLNYELATEKNNYSQLKDKLDRFNKELDSISTDYKNNLQEFEKWKNKPVEIKYKEVKSNECKDIKLVIDDIRNNPF